jgi:hypothetical protein
MGAALEQREQWSRGPQANCGLGLGRGCLHTTPIHDKPSEFLPENDLCLQKALALRGQTSDMEGLALVDSQLPQLPLFMVGNSEADYINFLKHSPTTVCLSYLLARICL